MKGADAIDTVTTWFSGWLYDPEMSSEVGKDLILCGGILGDLRHSCSSLSDFKNVVKDWPALKDKASAQIVATVCQESPGEQETRILRMVQLVAEFGNYE